jgi:hypothetical protein
VITGSIDLLIYEGKRLQNIGQDDKERETERVDSIRLA